MPPSSTDMQYYDRRLASFSQQTSTGESSKSRSIHGAKSTSWPHTSQSHPYLSPSSLATAGFYYTPRGEADNDLCTCFMCKKSLSGWEPEDDPFQEHLNRGGCAWAMAVCGIKVGQRKGKEKDSEPLRFENADSLPRSSAQQKYRVATFGKNWPHKGKRAFLPASVTKLAQAGFVYNPTEDADDCVTCFYCGYSAEEWEAKDDPWELHLRKSPVCQFFHAKVGDIIGTENGHSGTGEPSQRPTRVAKAAKSKSTKSSTLASSQPPSAAPSVYVNLTTEPSLPPTPPPKAPPKKPVRQTRARKGSVSVSAERRAAEDPDAGQDGENELPGPEEVEVIMKEVEEAVPAKSAAAGKKGKGRATKARATARTTRGRTTVAVAASDTEPEVQPISEQAQAGSSKTVDTDINPVDELDALVQEVDLAANDLTSETDHDMQVEAEPAVGESTRSGRGGARNRGRGSKAARSTTTARTTKGKTAAKSTAKSKAKATDTPSHTTVSESDVEVDVDANAATAVADTETTASVTSSLTDVDPAAAASSHAADGSSYINERTPRQRDDNFLGASVIQGALETRAVMASLGSTSMRLTPRPPKMKAIIPQAGPAGDNPFLEDKTAGGPIEPSQAVEFEMTQEEGELTAADFVRYELGLRYKELYEKGQLLIADWDAAVTKSREEIEGV